MSTRREPAEGAAETRIVVVDTHHDRRQLMRYVLDLGSGQHASVSFADGPDSAVAAVERVDAHAALVEVQLPLEDGLETVRRLREAAPKLRIVVCSFRSDPPTVAMALSLGADDYLRKPLRPVELYQSLQAPAAAHAAKEHS
ncbi:response regulator [Acidiferrimicrobium sp. IK]|uniref:response regulator n=1 Tax=Acidiferrimicrobium sp. IK TaxID=2871700 RepID=UPI0021CB0ABA|nr:response regulator [Acidiferrimicrobium sp. IK]MCU4186260.1 response regulator [Acidiferrimicrobium sp. IK]